jgi:Tol biopolymer transport system component
VLVYSSAPNTVLRRLVWVDRKGLVTAVPLPPGLYDDPALSPDGRQIVLTITDGAGSHIWVYDIVRGTLGKRTFEGTNNFPIWSRDGQSLTFTRGVGYIGPLLRVRADGTGQTETLVTDEQQPGMKIATSWSADGKILAFQRGYDVIVRDDKGALHPALATPAYEREGRFAPNGRWMSYRSNETGRDEVYVQTYPPGGGKWVISTEGGTQAMWAENGRELFYKNGNKMMAVDVETGNTFKAGVPHLLFQLPFPERTPGDPSRYAVTPDGKRFLLMTTASDESSRTTPPINVVLNWQEELKQRVPAK